MDVESPNALKRCSSAPHINNLVSTSSTVVGAVQPMDEGQSQPDPSSNSIIGDGHGEGGTGSLQFNQSHLPVGLPEPPAGSGMLNTSSSLHGSAGDGSRESLPTSFSNIFTPRVRRFSASFSPLAAISNGSASPGRNGSGAAGPRLTPRISQLRQEECADVTNTREVNHEREIHSAMQMSQSYEDLTLVAENWSFAASASKMMADDLQNPLHVALPTIGSTCCSSPSPTSRGGIGLQYPTTSPSPTRKFVTRRSMSPCPLRPSPLSSSVKRKFDLDDNYGNCYSPPPKKIFTSERGSSPVCQTPSPSPICPSPDSSTTSFENGSNNNNGGNGNGSNHPPSGLFPLAASGSGSGRVTPKFFLSKLSGAPSPGPPGCLGTGPFGGNGGGGSSLHFGGHSASSSTCTTPTGPPNVVIGDAVGLGGPDMLGTGRAVAMMMDCGVSSSSSSSGSDCRETVAMEIGHGIIGVEGVARPDAPEHDGVPVKADSSTSGSKMACDQRVLSLSDSQRQHTRTGLASSGIVAASRELREQILKSVLDPDAAGSCNSNSSYTSSTSTSSSSSSNSSCVTNDSNTSANSTNSRLGGHNGGSSSSSGGTIDGSSTSSSGASAVSDPGAAAAVAAAAICPQLTSFPMMAIPSSNLAEIAES